MTAETEESGDTGEKSLLFSPQPKETLSNTVELVRVNFSLASNPTEKD